jgi:hypothetical protein
MPRTRQALLSIPPVDGTSDQLPHVDRRERSGGA